MKRNNRNKFCLLMLTGFLMILVYSCKDDDPANTTSPSMVIKDYDGNIYHSVTIGTQVWMVENLKVTHYRDGIPLVEMQGNTAWNQWTQGIYCNYDNFPSNGSTYGRLYNRFAVTDPRNIAPVGWHIPSNEEWQTLVTYLGGDTAACRKLKEKGIVHWTNDGNATNNSGFTALPGGYRVQSGDFNGLGTEAVFATTSREPWGAYVWKIDDTQTINSLGSFNVPDNVGVSIRCIKDK